MLDASFLQRRIEIGRSRHFTGVAGNLFVNGEAVLFFDPRFDRLARQRGCGFARPAGLGAQPLVERLGKRDVQIAVWFRRHCGLSAIVLWQIQCQCDRESRSVRAATVPGSFIRRFTTRGKLTVFGAS